MTAQIDSNLQKEIAKAFGTELMNRIRRGEFQNLNPCGPADDRILKLPDTEAVSGLSSSEIYRRMEAGTFPKNVKLSAKARGWRMSDLQAWISELETAA